MKAGDTNGLPPFLIRSILLACCVSMRPRLATFGPANDLPPGFPFLETGGALVTWAFVGLASEAAETRLGITCPK